MSPFGVLQTEQVLKLEEINLLVKIKVPDNLTTKKIKYN